jgi:4-amino-4-deoxy-L-arabinose transferase-like glycosyltransferase
LGAFIRLIGLETWTGGLWYDEALNGLLARGVLAGDRPIFFYPEPRNPLEPLFPYAVASVLGMAGASPTRIAPLRMASALIGVATLLAFCPLSRRLLPRRWALAAVLMLALLPWHVHFSRMAFRTNLAPLFVCLGGWRLLAWLESGRKRDAAIAGVIAGGAFYTYLAAYSLPIAMAATLALSGRWGRGLFPRLKSEAARGKALKLGLAVGCVAALLALGPFAWHAGESGGKPLRRAGTVALPLYAIPGNAVQALTLFFWGGDPIFRHGPPDRPLFSPALAVVFWIGVATLAKNARARRGAGFFVLIAAAGFVAVSALSQDAPHKLRTLGAAPLAVLALLQGARTLTLLCRRRFSRRIGHRWARGLAVAGVAALLGHYLAGEVAAFRDWSRDPQRYFEFSGTTTGNALWARGDAPETVEPFGGKFAQSRDLSIPLFAPRATVFDDPTFRYLTSETPNIFPMESLERVLAKEPGEPERVLLLVTAPRPENAQAVAALAPDAEEVAVFANPVGGEVWARAFLLRRRDAPLSPAERETAQRFNPRT